MRGVQGEIELQGDTEGQEIKGQRGPRSPVPSSPGSDGVLSQVGVNGVHGRQKVADRPLGCLPVQELGAVSDSRQYAQLLAADSGAEMEDLENSIEDMLVRLDEFCAMMDMIRNETSHILEEKIPALTIKVEEMNKIYSRVDKLEAFVKMVGHHVTFLEEEVAQAESDHLSFPQALNRMIQGAPIPLLLRKKASKPPKSYELPKLYRTEDYFPPHYIYVKNEKSYQILPSGL
ncbi:breast carcinoma-amplified sequence 4 isoform X1 [Spea bombifrons]|uniref:breast carcinoma-amplified sequence 4 isoform X1 n=1 Tax=Spea bombifrons TaxID=233779 RepID=UPI00234937AF|nr:breast carcinoma-amplified sequence 4 isoform X1 [Spea bombifrons]